MVHKVTPSDLKTVSDGLSRPVQSTEFQMVGPVQSSEFQTVGAKQQK